jgi:hypothetical protein
MEKARAHEGKPMDSPNEQMQPISFDPGKAMCEACNGKQIAWRLLKRHMQCSEHVKSMKEREKGKLVVTQRLTAMNNAVVKGKIQGQIFQIKLNATA